MKKNWRFSYQNGRGFGNKLAVTGGGRVFMARISYKIVRSFPQNKETLLWLVHTIHFRIRGEYKQPPPTHKRGDTIYQEGCKIPPVKRICIKFFQQRRGGKVSYVGGITSLLCNLRKYIIIHFLYKLSANRSNVFFLFLCVKAYKNISKCMDITITL